MMWFNVLLLLLLVIVFARIGFGLFVSFILSGRVVGYLPIYITYMCLEI